MDMFTALTELDAETIAEQAGAEMRAKIARALADSAHCDSTTRSWFGGAMPSDEFLAGARWLASLVTDRRLELEV